MWERKRGRERKRTDRKWVLSKSDKIKFKRKEKETRVETNGREMDRDNAEQLSYNYLVAKLDGSTAS